MLPQTGERQIAETIEGIKPNHRNRYAFAANMIQNDLDSNVIQTNVIDCACGVGYGTMMLAEAGMRTHGFDIEPGAIEVANRVYKRDNNEFHLVDLSNSEQWQKTVSSLEDKIDAIVSIETVEHVEDAVALIARYAETAPYLVASVPNEDIIPFKKGKHPFHYRHYTRGQFEELLNDHGYEIGVWATQYDKIPGIVYEDADDGMGFIVSASKMK